MQRVIRVLLCLALVLALPGACALISGDIQYELSPDGTAVLTRWMGTEAEPVIPDLLDGHPLTVIGEGAFRDNPVLARVRIPEGVVSVAPLAFYNCASLTALYLPASLREIGDFAFAYCAGLRLIVLPEGTRHIGEYAFGDCASLTAAVLPDSVSHIGPEAFFGAAQGFGLYGGEGSAAQRYAHKNGIPFGAPGDAPSTETEDALPEEPPGPAPVISGEDDEPAAFAPAPETLSGLWMVSTTYESWHGEDGVEKEWNHTWSSAVLLELGPDGKGTWTEIHEWGRLTGTASYEGGALVASLYAHGPSRYEGKADLDGARMSLAGRMTEESHTDKSMWTKGPWTAVKLSERAELDGYRDLREGSAGKDVAAMKRRLFELGYFRSDPGTDRFTDKTADAVKAFEKANNLPPDGTADPVTQALLYSEFAKPKPR